MGIKLKVSSIITIIMIVTCIIPKRPSNTINLLTYDSNKNIISVYSKYSKTEDLKLTFEKFSVNQLLALHSVFKNNNANNLPIKFTNGVIISNGNSDWISPYKILALNNGNGSTSHYFTGGTHGTNNNANNGLPTAKTIKYDLYADGIRITSTKDIYANTIELYVTNNIMAYNTSSLVRYVIEEKVHYVIRNGKVDVNVEIKALEDIILEEYYGLQCLNNFYTHINYINGKYNLPQTTFNSNNDSGEKSKYNVNKFILSKSNTKDSLVLTLDNRLGLGKREWLPNNQPCAFSRDYEKSYMKLVYNNKNITPKGTILKWNGSYQFYKQQY